MEEKLSGIVLGGINFGDNDKILKIFTLEKGVVSAKIKGVKKAGAKLKFAAEPFSFVEFIFSARGDLYTVIGASLIDSFYPIRENVEKYFCAGVIVEFIKKFYKENIQSAQAFFSAIEGLKQIAYGDDHLSALAKYLCLALKEAGFALTLNVCARCDEEISGRAFFDYRSGSFFCETCFDGVGREINLDTFSSLSDVYNDKQIKRDSAVRALKLLEYYVQNRTEEKFFALQELVKIL